MNKVLRNLTMMSSAAYIVYSIARERKETVVPCWHPVKEFTRHISLNKLCKLKCNLDYPCPFECEDSITCKMLAQLCKLEDIRCDVIIRKLKYVIKDTYWLYVYTANACYTTTYNPDTGEYYLLKFEKR